MIDPHLEGIDVAIERLNSEAGILHARVTGHLDACKRCRRAAGGVGRGCSTGWELLRLWNAAQQALEDLAGPA